MSSNDRRPYVTQADIAREAGVSRPLVSLVLRNSPKVSQEKRERVLKAAAKLGYIGSGIATSLAGNRSNLLVGYLAQNLRNELFIEVYQGMRQRFEPLGHRILIMEGSPNPEDEDRKLRDLISFRPDAVVLGGYAGSTSALKAASNTLPFVSVTRKISEQNVFSVLGDDYAGGMQATEHLLEQGHTAIAHIQLPSDIPYERRAQGYVDAMTDRGLTPRLATGGVTTESGYQAAKALLDSWRPTAIFCATDQLALGALDALRERGLRVPGDVALVGYDNTDTIRRLDISSVDQEAVHQGEVAAMTIIAANENEKAPPPVVTLTPRLMVRGSSTIT